jgi:hypothetical protein
MKNYNDYVIPYLKNFTQIYIESETVEKIKKFVLELIKVKAGEQHHFLDSQNEAKRFFTGFMGEAAIEKLFNIKIIDWTIGQSSTYHTPDLKKNGYDIGIKTVEYGKFPIIFKKSYKPEIILIKIDDCTIFLCGLATVEQLNTYQDDELILSPGLRMKGTKTGFYNFKDLKKIERISNLDEYRSYG